MRPDRPADKLTESYENLVQRQPIFPVSKAGQFLLSLLRRLCLNHPNSVENPMNVGIDGNRGCLEPIDEDAVGGLPPNRRELKQLLHVLRYVATVLVEQDLRDLLDCPGFCIVEAYWFDESRNGPSIRRGQALDIWESSEEPGGC